MRLATLTLCAMLALGTTQTVSAQDKALTDLRRAMQLGNEALTSKDYKLAERSYKLAIELSKKDGVPAKAKSAVLVQAHYNRACCLTHLGKTGEALKALNTSVEQGFKDWDHLSSDSDLAPLRKLPAFQAWLKKKRGSGLQSYLKKHKAEVEQARTKLSAGALFKFQFKSKDVVTGKALELKASKGKVLLVDIWGTAFKPSVDMIDIYKDLQSELRGDGFKIVGLAYERGAEGEKAAGVKRLMQLKKANYPSGLADDPLIDQIPTFAGFPTTLLIDKQGQVRHLSVGKQDKKALKALIVALLTEKPGKKGPAKKVDGKGKKATPKVREIGPF
ncbi:MAG: hypothetical protein P1V97_05370 [Planctomycetota bacterium]|nr:hypothetical protein [Planctomycetota bacterium]